ncbi:MAG: hypothetical protein HFJ41_00755 [Clostridia bacterium]|nr:hypothetical protein [Clostridia bacterium]
MRNSIFFANNLLKRSNDVSVRTNRTDRYKYHSEKNGIFLLQNCHPKGKDDAKNGEINKKKKFLFLFL